MSKDRLAQVQVKEDSLARLAFDCKMINKGLPPFYDKKVELTDKHKKVLESIPIWSWEFTPQEQRTYNGIMAALKTPPSFLN